MVADMKGEGVTFLEDRDQLTRLIASMPGFFFVCEPGKNRTMRFVSEGVREILGYTPDELIGDKHVSFGQLINAADLNGILTDLDECLVAHKTSEHEYCIDTRSEGEKWVLERSYGVYDGAGNLTQIESYMEDITDRKQAEMSVHESEARFRRLFEDSPLGMALSTPDRRMFAVNRAFCRMLGYREDELIGRKAVDVTHPDDLDKSLDHAKKLLAGEVGASQREKRYLTKSGEIVWGNTTLSVIRDDSGKPLYSLGMAEDITERKEAERRLQEIRERFAAVINHSPDLIILKDSNIRYLLANRTFEEWNGVAEGAWLGKTDEEILPPEMARAVAKLDREVLTTNEVIHQVLEVELADGLVHNLEITKFPVRDSGGQALGVGTIASDVTAEMQALGALRESEARVRAIVNHSPDLIVLKDKSGKILLANRRIDEWHSLDQDATVGKTDYDFLPRDLAMSIETLDKRALTTNTTVNQIMEIPFADGELHKLEVTKFPVKDDLEQVLGVGTISVDVTQLREAEEKLRQAQKLEAVGQLAGGIAHEFNNLLMAVGGSLEYLESHLPSGDENLARILTVAQRATQRGADLTDRMLSYGRKQMLRPEPLDINDALAQSVLMLETSLGAAIKIESVLSGDLWSSYLDRGQTEAAFLNLAINARDAMPDGGTLTFTTSNIEVDEANARSFDDVAAGDYVLVKVTDTGMGMAPEIVDHVFEPFFTTKDVGKGSGLGLSMVHGFAKQSGGHVGVESVEGEGTSIKLYLPRTDRQPIETVIPTQESDTKSGGGKSAIVVEDDKLVLSIMRQVVTDLGYTVTEAENAAEALAAFEGHPQVELVLTDVIMPGDMDGIGLAREIQQQNPETKIIVMSGYTQADIESRGLSVRGLQLLRKPFRRAELIEALRAD